MNDQEPKYFTTFKNELYEKLDAHAEQIAYVTEEITGIKGEIKEINGEITGIKGELAEINKKLDSHEEQIVHVSEQGSQILKVLNSKADSTYVENIDFRTKKLEKFVFV